ncbi:zinc ribbon domain-containing protein [Candidatus Thorarchaeota archaeon]|nr:MAG: zinc ribbon domain-containing protein [Candidatus Thorarchaeota archaeon]
MRNCEKCGKANQPTRKFCIRCGASLIKKEKPAAAPVQPPKPEVPVTHVPVAPQAPPVSRTTNDQWVKPSEVSRDRVRAAGGGKQKSELEKAREAFAKAETVGIEEADGSGVIETRMLRASEVRELLEGPGMMPGEDIPPPTMMEGSEPLPPEAAEMMRPAMPSSSQIEESILGSRSAYVEHAPAPTPKPTPIPTSTPEPAQPTGFDSTPVPAEFASSKYESDADTIPPGTEEEEVSTGFAPHTPPVTQAQTSSATEDDIDLVIACPDCGKTINVDMFEYPREVYSAMGAARLKQARFFIVQGKGHDALRIIRMAHALYTKAGDNKGLSEVKKIIETLAKKP